MFSLRRFTQSLFKKTAIAIASLMISSKSLPIMAAVLNAMGVPVDPQNAEAVRASIAAGLFAAFEGGRMWLTHQSWFGKLPAIMRMLL